MPPPPRSTLSPYTPLFRSRLRSIDPDGRQFAAIGPERAIGCVAFVAAELIEPGDVRSTNPGTFTLGEPSGPATRRTRSEAHTSELQSRQYLACRLLLDIKQERCACRLRVMAASVCCCGVSVQLSA